MGCSAGGGGRWQVAGRWWWQALRLSLAAAVVHVTVLAAGALDIDQVGVLKVLPAYAPMGAHVVVVSEWRFRTPLGSYADLRDLVSMGAIRSTAADVRRCLSAPDHLEAGEFVAGP